MSISKAERNTGCASAETRAASTRLEFYLPGRRHFTLIKRGQQGSGCPACHRFEEQWAPYCPQSPPTSNRIVWGRPIDEQD